MKVNNKEAGAVSAAVSCAATSISPGQIWRSLILHRVYLLNRAEEDGGGGWSAVIRGHGRRPCRGILEGLDGFTSSLPFRYSVTFMVRLRKSNGMPPLFGLSSFL